VKFLDPVNICLQRVLVVRILQRVQSASLVRTAKVCATARTMRSAMRRLAGASVDQAGRENGATGSVTRASLDRTASRRVSARPAPPVTRRRVAVNVRAAGTDIDVNTVSINEFLLIT